MITGKHINKICIATIALMLVITLLFINAGSLGVTASESSIGYEERLFDRSYVHTIDIVMDDWDELIENATTETYYNCTVVIDGEAYKNVAIRGKGNTSLSSVEKANSDRYSFKIEFDHYQNGRSYHGLDKLCLNNLIQDNTYMKDYLAYVMMDEFGVNAPLCSFVFITVNGEDWGLYLAVEGIEDSFLERCYDSEGELYKPDSMAGGGGRGNGQDFDMDQFLEENGIELPGGGSFPGGDFPGGDFPGGDFSGGDFPGGDFPGGDFSGGDFPGGGFPGGSGPDDVYLRYTSDDADDYPNIFNNAKTDITEADKKRLVAALRDLSNCENLEEVLNMDEVLRYFVVHDFLVNDDSYTGTMVHNYYLHESDGQLEMIPWDYNLAFGTFTASDVSGAVNDPIDTPVSGMGSDDRPMVSWIFSDEEYTESYHEYYRTFVSEFIENGRLLQIIDETAEMIAPYVQKDATAFCTYEQFETAVQAIRSFCELRGESVTGQLDGSIPSTEEGQAADSSALIDTGDLDLSEMGAMGVGGPGGFGGPDDGDRPEGFGGPDKPRF
ncbi:MAG: CotH kinase family protein [Lachnospiraceae bacterium]|nr:CotH kinase family protein [Lachnospiraceae bacterium]